MLAPLVHVLVRWKVPSGRAGGGEAGRSALNQRRGGWVAPNTYGDPCGQAYAGRQDCPPDLEPSTRWISSLCHECEQVGLIVSIDTHHSFPAIILSMTDTRERRRPPLRAFTADPTHPRVPVQACPSGVTKLGTEYSCSAAEALIRLIPRRFRR